jgi:hypothetical protein
MKTLNDITLHDLMSEDMDVWVTKHTPSTFEIQIDDENGSTVVEENLIHEFAIDSFARFCRYFLFSYNKAIKKELKLC